jgi:PAS domain S-box-containing protein
MNFMILVFASGLLLGARAGFITTVLCALTGLVFVIAENNELITTSVVMQTPLARWFSGIAIFTVVAVMQGISSRMARRALNDAREAETRYRTLVEQIPAVTYLDTTAPVGMTEYISPQVLQLLGIDQSEWLESDVNIWLDLIHPDDRDAVHSAYLRSSETGVSFDMEYRMVLRNEMTIWVHDKSFVLLDSNGNPKWVHGVMFDITEQKQAQMEREKLITELEAKNAEMERFVYTVSHDLKSPIVTIVGFLGYLEEDVRQGNLETIQKDIDRVYQAAFKMQDLLKDLLELSRVGRVMNESETVTFASLVDDALELTHGRLQEHKVGIKIATELPVVYGDRRRLLELVQNLIDNAAKYMGNQPNPLIEIGVMGHEDDMPVIFVRDNGIGIPSEFHERIFGLFNKLNLGTEGTGVGLALVKRIVEVHGGRVWIESEAGKGSTFYFTLPQET